MFEELFWSDVDYGYSDRINEEIKVRGNDTMDEKLAELVSSLIAGTARDYIEKWLKYPLSLSPTAKGDLFRALVLEDGVDIDDAADIYEHMTNES